MLKDVCEYRNIVDMLDNISEINKTLKIGWSDWRNKIEKNKFINFTRTCRIKQDKFVLENPTIPVKIKNLNRSVPQKAAIIHKPLKLILPESAKQKVIIKKVLKPISF